MTTIDAEYPAFPQPVARDAYGSIATSPDRADKGATIRTYIATEILAALLSNPTYLDMKSSKVTTDGQRTADIMVVEALAFTDKLIAKL